MCHVQTNIVFLKKNKEIKFTIQKDLFVRTNYLTLLVMYNFLMTSTNKNYQVLSNTKRA